VSHLTYPEAGIVGLIQGVTELFPISSLGHNVLIPQIIGGSWAQDLNVSASESPYLAYIVGLHVATAIAMIVYFWRDWLRIIGGFFTSIRDRSVETPDQRLAWMIIFASVPVGIAGLALEHLFRVAFSKPIPTALFLTANGMILFAGERLQRRRRRAANGRRGADRRVAAAMASDPGTTRPMGAVTAEPPPGGVPGVSRHSAGHRAERQQETADAVEADRRLSLMGYAQAIIIGTLQILALLPGISRDGIVMVGGMFRGLTREDAARFSFLLSAPVILAAGAIKIPDLTGQLGKGIHGQILLGSILSFVGAYLALRFFMRYVQNSARTLTPFAVYCVVVGLGSAIYLTIR
jgi:undecaprenyl-diphosphatase